MASQREVRAGRAYIEMFLKDGAFRRGIRMLGRQMKSLASTAAAAFSGIAALGVGSVLALRPAIAAASELEETMNKFNVVFGDNAKEVQAWGEMYGKQVGRSKTQTLGFLASVQDLLVPLGFAASDAEEMSKQITALTVDLASFNNLSDADVMRDLQAALTGSGEVMKKYGVVISETTLKQRALNEGLDPRNLSERDKALLRFQMILEGTTAAQGDAIRSADSYANQVKATQAALVDIGATIGAYFLPILADGLKTVQAFVSLLGDGDFAAAGELAWAQLATIWEQGTYSLRRFWIDAFTEIQKVAFGVFESVVGGWETMITSMRNLWSDAFAFIEKTIVRVMAFFDSSIDLQATLDEIERTTEETKGKRRGELATKLQELSRRTDEWVDVATKGGAAEKAGLGGNVLAAQEKFQRLRNEALAAEAEVQTKLGQNLPSLEGLAIAVANATGTTGSGGPTTTSMGLFDARFASQMFGGGDNVQRQQLRELQGINRKISGVGGIPVTA